jgi:Protein of unknown function (DUF2934)
MASRRSPDRPAPAKPASRTPRTDVRKSAPPTPRMALTREGRHALIAEKAYLRAERRGFAPGHATEDWLAAEAEVDVLLKVSLGGSAQ